MSPSSFSKVIKMEKGEGLGASHEFRSLSQQQLGQKQTFKNPAIKLKKKGDVSLPLTDVETAQQLAEKNIKQAAFQKNPYTKSIAQKKAMKLHKSPYGPAVESFNTPQPNSSKVQSIGKPGSVAATNENLKGYLKQILESENPEKRDDTQDPQNDYKFESGLHFSDLVTVDRQKDPIRIRREDIQLKKQLSSSKHKALYHSLEDNSRSSLPFSTNSSPDKNDYTDKQRESYEN
mmetsp:Transcript_26358/g.40225  ORF Transcript_26358/g.40225 Transcript_26358/m.40225 type:complete len:233 (+) Transcript_26358:609-1307(+)